jgi:cytochrome b6-f complex iron-sulfur subunit
MKSCDEKVDCSGRREFLVKAAFLTGGLVLTLSGVSSAFGKRGDDVVVNIDAVSPLNKVGGSVVVDSPAGKVIILRTGDATFVAFAAKCTHRGGTVDYDAAKKHFVCPKHGSEFDASNGEVANGPAKKPLTEYKANGSSASVTVKVGS